MRGTPFSRTSGGDVNISCATAPFKANEKFKVDKKFTNM